MGWKHVFHHSVNCNRSKKRKKRIEDDVNIIIAKTEKIKNRHNFDEKSCFYIIPPGIMAGKKITIARFITAMKKTSEKINRMRG